MSASFLQTLLVLLNILVPSVFGLTTLQPAAKYNGEYKVVAKLNRQFRITNSCRRVSHLMVFSLLKDEETEKMNAVNWLFISTNVVGSKSGFACGELGEIVSSVEFRENWFKYFGNMGVLVVKVREGLAG